MHKVFLSSTWRDMADRRAAILRAIRVLDGFDVEAMEEFGLSPQPRLEVCLKKLPERRLLRRPWRRLRQLASRG